MHGDVFGVAEGEAGEVRDAFGLCGAEEEGLPVWGEVLEDGVDVVLKPHV